MGGIQNQGNPDEHHCQRLPPRRRGFIGLRVDEPSCGGGSRTKKSALSIPSAFILSPSRRNAFRRPWKKNSAAVRTLCRNCSKKVKSSKNPCPKVNCRAKSVKLRQNAGRAGSAVPQETGGAGRRLQPAPQRRICRPPAKRQPHHRRSCQTRRLRCDFAGRDLRQRALRHYRQRD